MNAKQRKAQTAQLATIDAQIVAMKAIVQTYADSFPTYQDDAADIIGAAWNAAHDAVTELEFLRREVEMGPRPTGGTWDLIAQNID